MAPSVTTASASADSTWPPLVWARTDLDAFLLFEAASRGDIPIYTKEPELAERQRLTRSGQIIIWDETALGGHGKPARLRWNHTVPWSASRMIRNYLTYRQMFPKNGPRLPCATDPKIARTTEGVELEYDLFCALHDHAHYPAEGLMRRTMSLKLHKRKLHLINFYDPYSQMNSFSRLFTPSQIPAFSQYIFDISPEILRHEFRRPPTINIVRYSETNHLGITTVTERPVYGGEWRDTDKRRKELFEEGKKYWAVKLGIEEAHLEFFAQNRRSLEVQLSEEERALRCPLPAAIGKKRGRGCADAVVDCTKRKKARLEITTSYSSLSEGDADEDLPPAYETLSDDGDQKDGTWLPGRLSSNSRIRASPSIARHPVPSHRTRSPSIHRNTIMYHRSSPSSTESRSSTQDAFPSPFFPSALESPPSISNPGPLYSPSSSSSPILSAFEPVPSPPLGSLSPSSVTSAQEVLRYGMLDTHPTLDTQETLHSGHRELSLPLVDWRAALEVETRTKLPSLTYPPAMVVGTTFPIAQAVSSPTIQYGFGDQYPQDSQPAYFDYQKHPSVPDTPQYSQQLPDYCYSAPTPDLASSTASTSPYFPPYESSDPYLARLLNQFAGRTGEGSQTEFQPTSTPPSIWSSENAGGSPHSSVDMYTMCDSWSVPTRAPTPLQPPPSSIPYHPHPYDQPQQHLQGSYLLPSYESGDIAAPQPTKAEWPSWFLPPNYGQQAASYH